MGGEVGCGKWDMGAERKDGWVMGGKKWKGGGGEEKGESRRGVGLCDWVSGIGSV